MAAIFAVVPDAERGEGHVEFRGQAACDFGPSALPLLAKIEIVVFAIPRRVTY